MLDRGALLVPRRRSRAAPRAAATVQRRARGASPPRRLLIMDTGEKRYSRRTLLGRAGAGALALGAVRLPAAVAARSDTVATAPTAFGRLFPELPAFAP